MENDFGEKSLTCNCPSCDSEKFEARRICRNPDFETDFLGRFKNYIIVKYCLNCFNKYWHHIPPETIEFYSTLINRKNNN